MGETVGQRARRWKTDMPLWCRDVVRIRTKTGEVQPFVLNAAQERLHAMLERQRAETGRVRAVVLKGRQMGSSTYLVTRIAHACHVTKGGVVALTLAQDDETAKKMGRMVQLIQDTANPQYVRHQTRAADHEKHWQNGSYYEFRTATERSRRGGTPHRLHYTEMAYFSHPAEQMAGTLQQMATMEGTEAIFESTARGPVGAWHELWREANTPGSIWMPVFLPWTLMPEYTMDDLPAGFTLDAVPPNDYTLSEVEYAETHGCTLHQMAWRRDKVRELGSTGEDGWLKFAHEYPACADDAFGASSTNAFLNPRLVEAARRRNCIVDHVTHLHPLVVGVDPAPPQGDSQTAVVWRRGNVCYRIERRSLGFEEQRDWLLAILEASDRPAVMCIDSSEGTGQYLVEALINTAAGAGRVHGVKFGGSARRPDLYENKRAEIWSEVATWLQRDASIVDEQAKPGRPSLASEMLAPERVLGEGKRIKVEPKEKIIRRLGHSPDGADALALTFAVPAPDSDPGYHVMAPAGLDDVFSRLDDEQPTWSVAL